MRNGRLDLHEKVARAHRAYTFPLYDRLFLSLHSQSPEPDHDMREQVHAE